MSLINDALKKAQKLRTQEPAETAPPMPGATPKVAKRAQPRSTQSLLLLVTGGVVLIGLSVAVTVYLISSKPSSAVAAKPAGPKPADATAANPPVIKVPMIAPAPETTPANTEPVAVTPAPTPIAPGGPAPKPPVVATTPASTEPKATAPETKPAGAPPPPSTTEREPVPVATATPPPVPQPTPAPQSNPAATATTTEKPATTAPASTPSPVTPAPVMARADERVHAFVDAIRVTGIRSSGSDSKVLMNERVFRVNDIVDRNLGLRLTSVAPDSLTFTDPNGVTYVKNF